MTFKEGNEDNDMNKFLVIGIIIIVVLSFVLIPVVDVLSVNVQIPPQEIGAVLIKTRITMLQFVLINPWSLIGKKYGDIIVNVTLESPSHIQKYKNSFYLNQNNWLINTYSPVAKGDIATIEMPLYDFKKVILVE